MNLSYFVKIIGIIKINKLALEYLLWSNIKKIVACINDNKMTHYEFNGIKYGPCKVYCSNHLYMEYFYISDKLEGAHKCWWMNGQLIAEKYCKNGELHGVCKSWYTNGNIREEGFYIRGLLYGPHKLWNKNGQLDKEYFYKNGVCKLFMH